MSDILFQYHKVSPTTWVYLSSLLTIGLFFKFSRFWSIRNLDLILLILFSPGLILINYGVVNGRPEIEQAGYVWLFGVGLIFLLRLLLDPLMVRRPLLEPNLSVGGMTFIGISLLMFLMANVVNSRVAPSDFAAEPEKPAEKIAVDADVAPLPTPDNATEPKVAQSPGYPWLHWLPSIPTQAFFSKDLVRSPESNKDVVAIATARVLAILSHVAIVIGMVIIGYRHFDNIRTGIAAALLYLLLPYTAQLTGDVRHVLPAAMLIWAIEAYRRPFVAGAFIGVAAGACFYPIFLLPLWLAFYWQRGLLRFAGGVVAALAVPVIAIAITAGSSAEFWLQMREMFGRSALMGPPTAGFWSFDYIDFVYRIPVLALFFALCASFALWPAQKNLGTLMSCSAAVMLATQFWHPTGGGLFMAWYLPLLLLTVFRPNLEDRIALSVLGDGRLGRRRLTVTGAERAA